MKRIIISAAILAVFFTGMSFASGKSEAANVQESSGQHRLRAFVSVLPQTYFVEKIGGGRISIDVLVPPGKNPAIYEPTPVQVSRLSNADVFFSIGVPFEKAFLPGISGSLKKLRIADTSEGIEKRNIDEHHHGEEGEEHEAAEDPHIWLSPVLAVKQAENIHRALVELDPDGAEIYDAGLTDLKAELAELHNAVAAMLKPYSGRTLFIFHPTLGYFTDLYGLEQVAIESGGKQPSAAELSEIISHAEEENVKIVFVQPEFSREAAGVIADAIDGSVVVLNPLAPAYTDNLLKIAESIRDSYK